MRQRETRGNKKRPTSDRLSAVNEFFRHERPGNRPEDAARCRWRDGRHRRPSRSRIRGKPVFFGCCGVWDGPGEADVGAGLSTADTTTPCPRVTEGTKNEKPPPPRSPSRGAGIRSPCEKRTDRAQGSGILLPDRSALQIFIPQVFFANFHGFSLILSPFPVG